MVSILDGRIVGRRSYLVALLLVAVLDQQLGVGAQEPAGHPLRGIIQTSDYMYSMLSVPRVPVAR